MPAFDSKWLKPESTTEETCVTYEVRINGNVHNEYRVHANALGVFLTLRERNKHNTVELVQVISVRKQTRVVMENHQQWNR